MAPHGESVVTPSYPTSKSNNNNNNKPPQQGGFTKPPRLSNNNIQRTISDISFQLMSQDIIEEELQQHAHQEESTKNDNNIAAAAALPPISEVENAKCECCGMTEDYTPEYISKVRERFSGKWLCGLCSEAVKEEMERGEGKTLKEALEAHMSHCFRFNKLGRAFPVLCQAEAMRDLLKRSSSRGARGKSSSPKDQNGYRGGGGVGKKGGIARSTSCIPALAREIGDVTNFAKGML